MRYRFGSYSLDLDRHELVCGGAPIHLEPQAFAVLAHLIEQRHRVVPKEELLDEVWGDHFVSESALTTRIKHLRRALGDDGQAQRVIRTVHRVGYQFLPEVAATESAPAHVGETSALTVQGGWLSARGQRIFGRDQDLLSLGARVAEHRMVTVTGPAGVGKTALAAGFLAYRDHPQLAGAPSWVCELANTRDPAALPNLVLDALGQGQHSDAPPTESLLRALERQSAVLILDNCEHVAAGTAQLVDELLGRCPGVRIVATSRVPLAVPGESVLRLDPLDPESAVACFVARAADAGGQVSQQDPAVLELCQRLDRLPLALELAAARARLLTPAEIVARLDDRFRLLRDARGSDGRHRSLREAITWSWDGLTSSDQQVLAALTVFAGTFSLEDVLGTISCDGADAGQADLDELDLVDALDRLVSSSLLTTRPGPWGKMTFRLLESVRDFAAGHLDDAVEVRRRHALHFARLAERLDSTCQTDELDRAMEAMRAAWDNLRAAVGYASAAGDTVTIRRIVRAVGGYADAVQAYEVLDWCAHAALGDSDEVTSEEPEPLLAEARAVKARMLAHRGQQDAARKLAAAALASHESHGTLLSVVWCGYLDGDLGAVLEMAPRLVELSRCPRGLDRAFAEGFAAIAVAAGQMPDLATTAVTPDRAADGALGALDCLTAGLRLSATDPHRAAELLEAVVESSLSTDYRLLLAVAGSTLTQLTLPAHPPGEAMRILRRTLARYLERGMWVLISADTVMAAKLLADAGDDDTAARLLGARRASGYRTGMSEALRAVVHEEVAAHLGDRFEPLLAEGEAWRPPEAAEAALAALDRCLRAG